MKKILFSLLMTTLFVLPSSADGWWREDKAVTVADLPAKAQEFLKTYFADKKVSYAKQDNEWFDGSYTVHFTDGAKIEFTKKGEVEEIKNNRTAIPKGAMPEAIVKYVTEFYPDADVWYIEHDDNKWKVNLSNGVKIKFDSKFRVFKIDRMKPKMEKREYQRGRKQYRDRD